jgi:hypothetical protein
MSPLYPKVHPPIEHHRIRRGFAWGSLILAITLVLIYVFLDLIVSFATQKGLDRLDGASGFFKKCHVTILHPGYDVYGLNVVQMPLQPHKEPLFYADKVEMRWSWRELFHGKLVRRINVIKARVMVPMRPVENGKPAQPPLEIAKTLESVPSAGLERLAVHDSQLVLVDEHHEGQRLWLHDMELTVENIATRKELMQGLPVLVALRGKLQRSGALAVFLTVDPFDKGYTFAGSAELKHLKLTDLYEFTQIKGLSITRGEMDCYASVTSKRGVINGGVKPILTNVHMEAADGKFSERIKAALADVAVKIFSDRVPNRNAVAALIPIRGNIEHLDVQVTPAIMAVLRNAFVEGLSSSLAETPPPVSPEKQGVVRQAINALKKDNKAPVKAQPKDK